MKSYFCSFIGEAQDLCLSNHVIDREAISNYVLVAIERKRRHLTHSLHEILQVISITVLERISINVLYQKK